MINTLNASPTTKKGVARKGTRDAITVMYKNGIVLLDVVKRNFFFYLSGIDTANSAARSWYNVSCLNPLPLVPNSDHLTLGRHGSRQWPRC